MSDEKKATPGESDPLVASRHGRRLQEPKPIQVSWKWGILIIIFFFASLAANKILDENPLIDGHNDLAIMLRYLYKNHIYDTPFKQEWEKGGLTGHVDIPRIKKGKYGGAFWSAFMSCPQNVTDFSSENYYPIVRATLDQLDLYHRLALEYPKYFTAAPNADAALAAFEKGQFIAPYIIEGLHQIGNSLATLRLYHQLGVRYATLSWNCHNKYVDAAIITEAGGSRKSEPLWHGVSPAGMTLIREMNRMGMIVDLSHVSADTMVDVLSGKDGWKGSIAPPIFSHSSAYAICPHPRNVPDHVLQLVKKRNSVVMVNFAPQFVSCDGEDLENGVPAYVDKNNTITQVVRHIMHIGDLIGYDHVGIGSDYDGIETTPRGLEDVTKFPNLIAMLLKAGVSEEDCAKVAGRNLLRVWKEVDEVAAKMQKEEDAEGVNVMNNLDDLY
ncbi:dipeptidase 1 precursor [Rhizodiscina lignyota]|uniref:Dipeptidase n=1 Tax=Rhizodiscina lignyota TaxID=1504668 RepID=A0A9P4IBU5_9PEZI|nr:dipeptidase 1 precursor [Rhizodiscina lignyota]